MNDTNKGNTPESGQRPNHLETPGHGPQGIDKAPGEETSQDNVNFVSETQKGKKVDADLTNKNERPGEQKI
jgi:hypothetical protein